MGKGTLPPVNQLPQPAVALGHDSPRAQSLDHLPVGGGEGCGDSEGILHSLGKRAFLMPTAWPGLRQVQSRPRAGTVLKEAEW